MSDKGDSSGEERGTDRCLRRPWIDGFIEWGGLKKLFEIFISGQFQRSQHQDIYSEWRHDCLANLLRVLCIIGIEEMKKVDQDILRVPRMNDSILMHMPHEETLKALAAILGDATVSNLYPESHFRTGKLKFLPSIRIIC